MCLPCCVLTKCLVPFSKLEHPSGLEADVMPQMKRPELVSSQAQSLTKKYQETKELLKLQELKKRNMQAQLGLSLSHIKEPYFSEPKPSILESPTHELVQKTVSFLLHDSTEEIQELEALITDKPLTLKELAKLLRSHSCSQENEKKYHLQKVLETWKYQQEIENETLKKSLTRAGESVREYESRLLTIEDLVGKVRKHRIENLKSPYGPLSEIKNHSEANDTSIGMLSQSVELLTSENEALKQRCQEIVNQLTEADREIDRLKAELTCQQGGKQHHLVMEELKRLKGELAENQANAIDREYYERELNEKSLRLHEALVTLEELGNTLKDTEKKLQLKEATLKGLGFRADFEDEEVQLEEEQLKDILEASQAKLSEIEANLHSTEQHCLEVEARNCELIMLSQESERVSREKFREAENQIRMLQEKLEMKTGSKDVEAGGKQVGDKDVMKQVVKEVEMESEAISQVLDMLAMVDVNVETMLSILKRNIFGSSDEGFFVSRDDARLLIEEEFWSQMLVTPKITLEEDRHSCERDVAKRMMDQKRLMLLAKRVCQQAESEVVTESEFETMYKWLDNETYALIHRTLRESLEAKSNVLKQIASRIGSAKDDQLHSLALGGFLAPEEKQSSKYLFDALKKACNSYVVTRLKTQYEKEVKQKKSEICTIDCPNCPKLREAARDLESKLAQIQSQFDAASSKTITGGQTMMQVDGEPVEPLDKYGELHDTIARQRKELREVKDGFEQENEKLRQEVAKASEALRVCAEENVNEIDSLKSCMENLKKKHEQERANLVEQFDQEMEELRGMISLPNPEQTSTDESGPPYQALAQTSTLKERIQELVTQVSVMTQEMRRREEQEDIPTLRLKYEKDLENLKVEALVVLAVAHL